MCHENHPHAFPTGYYRGWWGHSWERRRQLPGWRFHCRGVNEFYANLEGLGDIFTRLITELCNFDALKGRYFIGEYLELIWQILVDEAGLDILFNTLVVETKTEA
jgi:hypothetical protein